jgi:hypothetical protein
MFGSDGYQNQSLAIKSIVSDPANAAWLTWKEVGSSTIASWFPMVCSRLSSTGRVACLLGSTMYRLFIASHCMRRKCYQLLWSSAEVMSSCCSFKRVQSNSRYDSNLMICLIDPTVDSGQSISNVILVTNIIA